jgi:hypothetical protein
MMRKSRISALLLLCLPFFACVKDQQAARTRLPGVDEEPEKHETPTPEQLPKETPPSGEREPAGSEELPPVEAPPK